MVELLKCPHCGAEVTWDNSMRFGKCDYCGSAVLNEKMFPQNIPENRMKICEDRLRAIMIFIHSSQIDLARKSITGLVEKYPEYVEGWLIFRILFGCEIKDALKNLKINGGGPTSILKEIIEGLIYHDPANARVLGQHVSGKYIDLICSSLPTIEYCSEYKKYLESRRYIQVYIEASELTSGWIQYNKKRIEELKSSINNMRWILDNSTTILMKDYSRDMIQSMESLASTHNRLIDESKEVHNYPLEIECSLFNKTFYTLNDHDHAVPPMVGGRCQLKPGIHRFYRKDHSLDLTIYLPFAPSLVANNISVKKKGRMIQTIDSFLIAESPFVININH